MSVSVSFIQFSKHRHENEVKYQMDKEINRRTGWTSLDLRREVEFCRKNFMWYAENANRQRKIYAKSLSKEFIVSYYGTQELLATF